MEQKTERQESLRNQIGYHYDGSPALFVAAFNQYFGEPILADGTVSRQLSGNIAVSNSWYAAYQLYFKTLKTF